MKEKAERGSTLHFLNEGNDTGVTLFTFSMKEWTMGAPLFTFSMMEKARGSTLHFLNEGNLDGAPTLHTHKSRRVHNSFSQ